MSRIEGRFRVTLGEFSLDADFSVPSHGVTALFGQSGSGKTTLLRLIAGLSRAPGRLVVDGEVWQDDTVFIPTHRRALGYVFQEASLFPHLSVRRNLEFGLHRIPATQRSSVVLPLPEAPSSATIWPFAAVKETPCRI